MIMFLDTENLNRPATHDPFSKWLVYYLHAAAVYAGIMGLLAGGVLLGMLFLYFMMELGLAVHEATGMNIIEALWEIIKESWTVFMDRVQDL